MSNIAIEYRISLSNSEFQMSQRFRVAGNIFENGPREDEDLFYTDKKDASSKRSGDTRGRGLKQNFILWFTKFYLSSKDLF